MKLLFAILISVFFVLSPACADDLLPIGDGSSFVCVLDEDFGNFIGKWSATSDYNLIRVKRARRIARRQRKRARKNLVQAIRQGNDFLFVSYSDELKLWKTTLKDVNQCWKGLGDFTLIQSEDSSDIPVSPSDIDACGVVGDAKRSRLRIINGVACSVGDSPVVRVEMISLFGSVMGQCSGTVVGPRTVITAAHCVQGAVASVNVVSGLGSFKSAEVSFHPRYNKGDVFEAHDVAVIRTLDELPTRRAKILPADDVVRGERGVIAGYGLDDKDRYGSLRAATVSIVDVYQQGIMISYSGRGSDGNTCSGDSGGPLLLARGNDWVLAGTTSWGIKHGCGAGDQSYFAHISDSVPWIAKVAPEAFQ